MDKSLRVLLVEDSEDDAILLVRELERFGFAVTSDRAEGEEEFRCLLDAHSWDLILADYSMPQFGSLAVLGILQERGRDIPVIIVSGVVGEETAVEGMRAGACDFLVKGNLKRLGPVVERELREARIRRERRKTEAALLASERRRLLHVQNSPLAVIEWDLDFQVISWNPAAERIFGYGAEEVVGQRAEFLVPTSARDTVADVWSALLTGEGGEFSENANLTKDGQLIECRWYNTPLRDDNDRVIAVASVAEDITERRQAEQARLRLETQLRQAQKLESIGTLAGGIAHDFNNILAAIIPYAHLAREDARDNVAVQESLDQILAAANRAKDLVQQILTFSRQRQAESRPMELQLVVKEALKFLRSALPSTIEIQSRIEPGLPAIKSDPTQMHQVLMNLCTNAEQAIKGKQGLLQVNVETRVIGVEEAQDHPGLKPGRYVELAVQDDGEGMDEATVKRIFDPFFTTKTVGEGTGLGLAVVHGIVRDHDGAVQVESTPGEGTCFTVLIPAVESTESGASDLNRGVSAGQGEHLLFVDDETSICRVVRRALDRFGYEVTAYTDPVKALEAFRDQTPRFNAVLTDLTMPGMTGLQLIEEIRGIDADVPVILATGFEGVVTPEDVRRLKVFRVIQKPISPADLAAVVGEALA